MTDEDGVREEHIGSDREGATDAVAGTPVSGTAMPASGRAAPVSRRRRATRGTDGVSAGRPDDAGDASDGIWSNDVVEVQAPWSLNEADMKIGGVNRIPRVTAVRARAAAPGHASLWFRRGLVGATTAAIALLLLLSKLEDDPGANAGISEQGGSSGEGVKRTSER